MLPYINFFGLEIQTYSIMAAIGFVLTAILSVKLGKNRNIPSEKSLLVLLVSLVGIFAGGHFLFALTNMKEISSLVSKGEFSLSSVMPYVSGMVFYGGLVGATLALWIYTKLEPSVSKTDFFDVFAVSVPLFHTFGRVGCFFAGCCYGVESDFGFSSAFNTSALHYGVSRFPVALVEAFANLLIFILLLTLFKKARLKGKLFFIYLSLYAPIRFVLEFFRGDEVRGFVFGLSTSQFISLVIVIGLLIYTFIKFLRRSSKSK